jgi:hypothetical protein
LDKIENVWFYRESTGSQNLKTMNEQKEKTQACMFLREGIQEDDPKKKNDAIIALRQWYPDMQESELVKNALAFLASVLQKA